MRFFMMRIALPSFLFGAWLIINNSFQPIDIIFGIALAAMLTWLAQWLRPLYAYPKKPLLFVKLVINVTIDIAKSNYDVGKLILLGPKNNATPGFLKIPLKITDPHALAALSCIITFTPGTVWSDYSEEDNILTLHVLDLKDEHAWRSTIINRYEQPLMEIFE